jgi:hypothetical protein
MKREPGAGVITGGLGPTGLVGSKADDLVIPWNLARNTVAREGLFPQ